MTELISHIAINGTRLGYSVRGEAPEKPAVVFAHGLALRSTAGPYEELLSMLARDYTVHALDLRGHGASADSVEGWTFDALADDIAAFSRALGLHDAVFVGHSFGAVIGLLAEIRHPGTFSALCLLSPGPADHRNDPAETLDFLIEHGHDREKLRGAFGRLFVRPPLGMLDSALDAVTLVDTAVHQAQKEQIPHFSIEDRLKDVGAPVLLICGQLDQVVRPEKQHDMARKLPRSKEVVFATEGHMMANESAIVAAHEVLVFLKAGSVTDVDAAGVAFAAPSAQATEHRDGQNPRRRVLLIGIDPDAVDTSDPDLPGGITREKIAAGIEATLADMSTRGWIGGFCSIRPDDSAEATIANSLAERWDCIVIGGGIRIPSSNLRLFERVVNAVRRAAPRTPIAFNTQPGDSADAAQRWLD